ncbi:hypothetical protein Ac2012v2_8371 [Leucoagaricus gongylophorus]
MDIIYVLLQIYIKIDIILLLGKLWMKLECYMCVQTLGVTTTHHFQKLVQLHVSIPLGGKNEDECFDRMKKFWNNLIRGSRSVYGKISPDSEMCVIHMIVG